MTSLLEKSLLLVQNLEVGFTRSLANRIDWSDRLIGILGARGTGKTTLLLQQQKLRFGLSPEALYLSLDDLYFADNRLTQVVESFRLQGGKALFLDEVHKYPDWAREIKNIYDFYKELTIVFTGSSITDILRQNADLSRRAIQYELPGLSFREYLDFKDIFKIESVTLAEILKNHGMIAAQVIDKIKPLQYFNDYLKAGYYPFFIENPKTYPIRLEQMVKMIIENDMRFIEGLDPANTRKILQLLYILAVNVPFKPNISKLSERIGMNRNTLVHYLHYLDKARLTNSLLAHGKSISILQKPDKIYLENTNLQYLLGREQTDRGSWRETFFLNQLLNAGHTLALPKQGDFIVDEKYTVEIGGKGKSEKQIKNIPESYRVLDDMEIGAASKIPLWLFGFIY